MDERITKEIFYGEVLENKLLVGEVYDMTFKAPKEVQKARAGQFLAIYTGNPSMLLPRPISICEVDIVQGTFRVIYRVAGHGTAELAKLKPGDSLRVLGPVGTAFKVDSKHTNFALVGGGIGTPPMLQLAKKIRNQIPHAYISVYLGFRSKFQVILENDLMRYANEVVVATDDGTMGIKGNVIDTFPPDPNFDVIYSCGPSIMLKFLSQYAQERDIPCYVSVEEYMACSVGACLACVVKVKSKTDDDGWDYKRVCMTGPVFNSKELEWK
ncbi:MAG: dihydroorotate dehydrogenase electron transfer subunit [Defluviitaleaceae bacterium]|nr:dihydroorotate dehydrogenase electron transfer subunit [Defluviitaleaceae bacterium]